MARIRWYSQAQLKHELSHYLVTTCMDMQVRLHVHRGLLQVNQCHFAVFGLFLAHERQVAGWGDLQ